MALDPVALAVEVQRLEGVIEAVELLHQESQIVFLYHDVPAGLCVSCGQVWPCDTINIINERNAP